jgi:hypothetical protein
MENLLLREKVAELQKLKGDNNRMKCQLGLMGRVKDAPLRPSAGNGSGKVDVPKPRIGSKPDFSGL